VNDDARDVDRLVAVINKVLPREKWTPWPGGWPDEIEAAVLDAVFSMQAVYSERPDAGPRGVVGAWRIHRGGGKVDNLDELAAFVGLDEELISIVGNESRGNRGRTLKAALAAEAAANLVQCDIFTAAEFREAEARQSLKRAWTSVVGLGSVTWEYLGMLLGRPGVKADVMIRRFVANAIEQDDVSADRARLLIVATAHQLAADLTALDHAIWHYQGHEIPKT
jgi:hypothetical protein